MFLLLLSSFLSLTSASVPGSPVIGIMSQQTGDQLYIAASYVKFIEMAGGRAVPLSFFATNETTEMWLSQLNGVLFPGGSADLPETAQYIVDYSARKYAEGDYFPVWGTCLGFEWLALATGGYLVDVNSENKSLPLEFTALAENSYLYGSAELRELLASEPGLTMNNHGQGCTPDMYAEDLPLGKVWNVLSTNIDSTGLPFVSSVEAKGGVPLFGVQWHPEKNTFENGQNPDGSPYGAEVHSADAVAVTFAMANKLANAARKSQHTFEDPKFEQAALFSNCVPTDGKYPEFVQSYYFPIDWDGTTTPCGPGPSGKKGAGSDETPLFVPDGHDVPKKQDH